LDEAAGVPIAIDRDRLQRVPSLAPSHDELTGALDAVAEAMGTAWRRGPGLIAFSPPWYEAAAAQRADSPLRDLLVPAVTLAEERAAEVLESLGGEQLGELAEEGYLRWPHLTRRQEEMLGEVFTGLSLQEPARVPGAARFAIRFGLGAIVRADSKQHQVTIWWDRPVALRAAPGGPSLREAEVGEPVVGRALSVLHEASIADLVRAAEERFGRRYQVDARQAARRVVLTRPHTELSLDALHQALTEPFGLVAEPLAPHVTAVQAIEGAERLLLYHRLLWSARRWLGGAAGVVSVDPLGEEWQAWPALPPDIQEKLRASLRSGAMRPTGPDIPLLRLIDRPEGLDGAHVRFHLLLVLEAATPDGRRCSVHFRPAREK
jgi:hypothetical protein